ncbi:helix-turn-helix domain-containing protein [Actinomadura barringtoniae]|uniref:Helix-turn-helix domain-containing protein n=1 Tax=Actinomadura barringtoniae TaxID=1427535 RepID=A0A939PAJ4_9ACTN|nr:helix-turn-helix domain-containing protein [Actinomadura barringtoniae]MBO2449081.1 helix-turn-helix domain-containing protein [Actinomadura barringtoniae]
MTFGEKLRSLMGERGVSLRGLAEMVPCDAGHLSKICNGLKNPSARLAERLDGLLGAEGALVLLRRSPDGRMAQGGELAPSEELEAVELARRVAASDVGEETMAALEAAVDDLASAYPRSAPAELLARTRGHLAYVARLMDVRMTSAERRRLTVVGGWLSLLAATCDVDLGRRSAAAARLKTAAQLAEHAGHLEILAWTLETQAWQLVTDGDHKRAITLSRGAQTVAPKNGSAHIQATAQEGRAWARLGAGRETRDALGRVERLVEPLETPDRPEHHFRYDPAKSDAYTATTLSWVGDPAAEPYARGLLARLERPVSGPARPRRAASARLDLALALVAADQPDEAAHTALEAVTSGRLVPSNYWRATEVINAVEALNVPEAAGLREAYRELCRADGGA